MNVLSVGSADIYRDGGSYGFSFDSDDGRWYEFFIQIRRDGTGHHPPVIYLEGVNQKQPVRQLTWDEAKVFVAPLNCDEPQCEERFRELVEIVMREGT